ncbi:MAG: FAD/NAD(P)-binding protein [Sphingomicrobium sp.]
MKSDAPVAIVGGGFSGTMVAAHLARAEVKSMLIDGSGRMGQGTAYATLQPAHLLNVRAEGMSAWPDDPQDFARRFEREGGEPRGFAQRQMFGTYLRDILADAVAAGAVETVAATVTSASRSGDGWTVTLDDGVRIAARALVLATGNEPPDDVAKEETRRFVGNPWGAAAQAAVAALVADGGDALIIGTGLTMVDLALSLDAAGFDGKILALSRRGLIPRGHAEFAPAPVALDAVPAGSARAVLRWLRQRGATSGWRAAVDSLRPHSAALWQGFNVAEQKRFMRHARPWWDVHRHRIAPEVAATIAGMIADGRLEIVAGRLLSVTEENDGLSVAYRRRGAAETRQARFAYGFNCTGPLQSIARTTDPLLRSLLDAGEVVPDQLGIGLAVDKRSRASDSAALWALGPLTKGRYWEIVAVPDIRGQAAAVASDIVQELGQ